MLMTTKAKDLVYSNQFLFITRDELAAEVELQMSKKRFKHVLGVEETAVQLAGKYGVSEEAASIAALCHDYAKQRPDDEMRALIKQSDIPDDLLDYGNNIWHGPCAAEIVKSKFQLMDEDILNAIRNHTVGRSEMSLLEQVIYVADYIEPGRSFSGVEEARKKAADSLQAAVTYETYHTIKHLVETKKVIYPQAIATFNTWVANK